MSRMHELGGDNSAEERKGPLAGVKAWLITDGKIGMDVQVHAVADALGMVGERRVVKPRALWRAMAPWGPADHRDWIGFRPPWPALALATGRQSIPYIRTLKRLAGKQTYTIVLQDPQTGCKTADLIWVPSHDRLRGANVISTLTTPHSYSPARLARMRACVPWDIAQLPRPRVAVILGGNSRAYAFTDSDCDRLKHALRAFSAQGASYLVTTSARTPRELMQSANNATLDRPRIFWTGTGQNRYPDFLAHADVCVVTADSVNMTSEACATGRPVYVFKPSRGSAKSARFHDALVRYGATRWLPDPMTKIESWKYEPLYATTQIAAEVEQRWLSASREVA